MGLVVQLVRLPVPERRRAGPDVDEQVEDRPARAAQQLGHPGLEVHAPNDAALRARVVVLNPLVVDAELGEYVAAIGFLEEATLVAVHDGLEEDGSFQAGFQALHGACRLSARSAMSRASASDEVAAGEGALRT